MSDTALFRTEAEMSSDALARSGVPSVDTSLGTISLRVTNDLQPVQDVWKDLQAHSPCTAAQAFDWAQAWAMRVLVPAGAMPVIAMGYDSDGKPLFLWPFETAKVAGLSVLKWLGQDHANYCVGLFQPGIAQRITASDLSRLLREVGREAGVAAVALKKQPFAWDGVPNPFAQLPYQPGQRLCRHTWRFRDDLHVTAQWPRPRRPRADRAQNRRTRSALLWLGRDAGRPAHTSRYALRAEGAAVRGDGNRRQVHSRCPCLLSRHCPARRRQPVPSQARLFQGGRHGPRDA